VRRKMKCALRVRNPTKFPVVEQTFVLLIPRRYSHFVFGLVQAGLTSLVASGIASSRSTTAGEFLYAWVSSGPISWCALIPIVLIAAPVIRFLWLVVTRDESPVYRRNTGLSHLSSESMPSVMTARHRRRVFQPARPS
jgi:hypothetical protein